MARKSSRLSSKYFSSKDGNASTPDIVNVDEASEVEETLFEERPKISKRRKTKAIEKEEDSRGNEKIPESSFGSGNEEIPVSHFKGYLEISIPDPTMPQSSSIEDTRPVTKRKTNSKVPSNAPKYNRQLRAAMREIHLGSLLISSKIRSLLCNDPFIQAIILSVCPLHIQNHFRSDERTLINGLSMLANWWKNYFGLRLSVSTGGSLSAFPSTLSRRHLWRVVKEKQGYEDDLTILLCALLRVLGVRTRLVKSLSLVPLIPDDPTKDTTGDFLYLPSNWLESYHTIEKRWVPIDGSRGIVNCRQSMEGAPGGKNKRVCKQHTFIIAVDEVGFLTDITKRYASRYYSNTWKLRTMEEQAFQRYLAMLNRSLSPAVLYDEEAELEAFTESEPMPESASGFQMHGKYVLESKLKKYETFWPPNKIVGNFKGDNIHLRSSAKKVRSKEAWYTQYCRTLKPDAVPVKVIQLPKKKKKGIIGPDEDPYEPGAMQPLYGEWQTDPYIPPEAANGKVPRNVHGNVDMFQPEMLPGGCAYIPYSGVWRSAKELGVDYADACVRFAFHGRMAVPNLQGIVVCKEDEEKVLHAYFKQLEKDLIKDNEELTRQELLKRRRQALSAKISERLVAEYGESTDLPESANNSNENIQSTFTTSAGHSDAEDFSFD